MCVRERCCLAGLFYRASRGAPPASLDRKGMRMVGCGVRRARMDGERTPTSLLRRDHILSSTRRQRNQPKPTTLLNSHHFPSIHPPPSLPLSNTFHRQCTYCSPIDFNQPTRIRGSIQTTNRPEFTTGENREQTLLDKKYGQMHGINLKKEEKIKDIKRKFWN